MIIKVCGVRTAAVADAAVEAGADWIGMVFVPRSPRRVDDAAAREVVAAVADACDLVGVLVDPEPWWCDELAERFGLAAVQVHGEVTGSFVERCSVPVIRALNVRTRRQACTTPWWVDGLLLLDAAPRNGEPPGGTGRRLPAAWAAEVARHRRILLAGGLDAGNVAEAIATVRPWGVDASSGLERSPGQKDPALVRAYVAAARRAFAALEVVA